MPRANQLRCYVCGAKVSSEDVCTGCGEHVCPMCLEDADFVVVIDHDPGDHLVEDLDEDGEDS